MRLFIFIALLSAGAGCFAQDPDYTDYRKKNEGFAHVTDKALRSDLSCFTIGGIDESMGKGKLKELPVIDHGNDFIVFDGDQTHVIIRASPFFPTKHKMYKEGDHLVKIDNKPYFGNYGKTPSMGISKVTVTIGKDTIVFPESAWTGLYNPGFVYYDGGTVKTKDAVYLSADKHTLYVYMLNKDDTGSYEVTWIIQNKQYLRRVIDWGFTP